MCCEYGWWRHCICIWEKEERGGEEGEGNVRRSSLEDKRWCGLPNLVGSANVGQLYKRDVK
jgi:hypothetical protein